MGSKEKLIERFKNLPKDFTYDEAVRLLGCFGYIERNKGKTSGSRVRFYNESSQSFFNIHKQHPGSIMKEWMMKELYIFLKSKKLI